MSNLVRCLSIRYQCCLGELNAKSFQDVPCSKRILYCSLSPQKSPLKPSPIAIWPILKPPFFSNKEGLYKCILKKITDCSFCMFLKNRRNLDRTCIKNHFLGNLLLVGDTRRHLHFYDKYIL